MSERVLCYGGFLTLSLVQLWLHPSPWPGYYCGMLGFALGLLLSSVPMTRQTPCPSQSSRSLGELPVTQQAETCSSYDFSYQTSSPLLLKTAPPGDNITRVRVVIDTAFDGSVVLTVGDTDDTDRLLQTDDIDVASPGTYDVYPTYTYTTTTELSLYITCSGSTQGAGRVVLD